MGAHSLSAHAQEFAISSLPFNTSRADNHISLNSWSARIKTTCLLEATLMALTQGEHSRLHIFEKFLMVSRRDLTAQPHQAWSWAEGGMTSKVKCSFLHNSKVVKRTRSELAWKLVVHWHFLVHQMQPSYAIFSTHWNLKSLSRWGLLQLGSHVQLIFSAHCHQVAWSTASRGYSHQPGWQADCLGSAEKHQCCHYGMYLEVARKPHCVERHFLDEK